MSSAKYSEHVLPLRPAPHRTASFRKGLRGAGTVARRAWRSGYVRRLVAWDATCALIAAAAGHLVRFGPTQGGTVSLSIAVALPAVWLFAMLASRSYEERFLWVGPEEFRRVFFAAAMLLAGLGTVSWALQLEVARGFVVIALPLATALTLVQRQAQREWLHRAARQGPLPADDAPGRPPDRPSRRCTSRSPGEAHHGYRVIGCCLPADQCGQSTLRRPAGARRPRRGRRRRAAVRGRHRRRPALARAGRAGAAPARLGAGEDLRRAAAGARRHRDRRTAGARSGRSAGCRCCTWSAPSCAGAAGSPRSRSTASARRSASSSCSRSCSASASPSRPPAAGRCSSGRSGSAATAGPSRC